AAVLATVRREGLERAGTGWSQAQEEAFKAPIREQYERQGSPYYSTARLWDDGVIDPVDTRRVLGMGLAVAADAPVPDPRYGIFRMGRRCPSPRCSSPTGGRSRCASSGRRVRRGWARWRSTPTPTAPPPTYGRPTPPPA